MPVDPTERFAVVDGLIHVARFWVTPAHQAFHVLCDMRLELEPRLERPRAPAVTCLICLYLENALFAGRAVVDLMFEAYMEQYG